MNQKVSASKSQKWCPRSVVRKREGDDKVLNPALGMSTSLVCRVETVWKAMPGDAHTVTEVNSSTFQRTLVGVGRDFQDRGASMHALKVQLKKTEFILESCQL